MRLVSRVVSFVILLIAFSAEATNHNDSLSVDSSSRRNIFQKIYDYVASANDPDPGKKFDFSIIGAPYYMQDTSLGIAVVAAGIFQNDTTNFSAPPGQISLYAEASITGYYKVGIEGSNHFNGDRIKLYYDASFESMSAHYWGIGYDQNRNDANEVKYRRLNASVTAALSFNVITPHLYVGPIINFDYTEGKNITDTKLWNYQRRKIFSGGIGIGVSYDSRDNIFNAYKGLYASINQTFLPKFIGNRYPFTVTEATLCNYFQVWKGGIIASQLHARITYGDTPWSMMSKFGDSYTMRGYWEGRYNDKCVADATLELRQHLFSRFGMVVWGGVGCVSPTVKGIFKSHALWNAGVGLRWEFKHRVNLRVDYGFGEHQNGLVFSINEAF